MMKRLIPYISAFIGILIIIVVIMLLLKSNQPKLVFKLIGNEITNVQIGKNYTDKGATATYKGEDISEYIKTDLQSVDTSKIGEFEVTYTIDYEEYSEKLIRYVRVNDNIAPELTLLGENPYIIQLDEVPDDYTYQDEGAIATDNLDEKISSKIQIIENVNPHKIGAYSVDIFVSDESGNTDHLTRSVYVVKDKNNIDYKSLLKENEITYMKFTDKGFFVKGYTSNDKFDNKISLCSDDCHKYSVKNVGGYFFEGEIDITDLENGTYSLELDNKKAVTYLTEPFRLWRGRIQDKMLTFKYSSKGNITITIDDFKYEYDIVIDPGHGGDDEGTANDIITEKELNLVQSKYEKERYEEHGLKVLMLRYDSSYGTVLGDESIKDISRKGLAVGYYSSVSKVSYSNHHNSNEVTTLSGWEIIAPAGATTKEMMLVNNIGKAFSSSYEVSEDHVRIYSRNYIDGAMFDKSDRQMYYFNDYYAVIRIPYDCFNTNNFIFEGSYLSNAEDFKYYYDNDNWKKFSEQKIKAVVEYLGKEYIAP